MTCACCGSNEGPVDEGQICALCAKGRHKPDCKAVKPAPAAAVPDSERPTQEVKRPPEDVTPPAAPAAPAPAAPAAKKGTDYRTLYDKPYLASHDLPEGGRDVTVTIERVEGTEIVGEGGKKDRKPVLYFVGKKKGMVCNITNGRTIAKMYGKAIEGWVGKSIAIYAGTTKKGGEMVDSLMVRGVAPAAPRRRA